MGRAIVRYVYATTALTVATFLASPAPNTAPQTQFHDAEVNVDDDGTLEVLAFDASGALVGALLAYPTEDSWQIDAQFASGFASIELTLGPEVPEPNLRTDLDPEVAVGLVNDMLDLIAPPTGPLEISKTHCMILLGVTAGTCGLATITPVTVMGAWACFSSALTSLCACAEYMPALLKVC